GPSPFSQQYALDCFRTSVCHPRADLPTGGAFAGQTGVGVDSGPFFLNAAGHFEVDPDDVASMIAAGNAEFAAGLPEGGLQVAAAQLELAASASDAVKFAWLHTAVLTATVSNWPTFNG